MHFISGNFGCVRPMGSSIEQIDSEKNMEYQMSLQNLSKDNAVANFLAMGKKQESMHILKENIRKVCYLAKKNNIVLLILISSR